MLRLFRVRAWCLAIVVSLAVGTAGASFDTLLHTAAGHDGCCTPFAALEHDETAHRYQAAGGAEPHAASDHCVACHWSRSFRSGHASASAAVRLDDVGAHAPIRTMGRALAPALAGLPARSPPRFS